MVAEPGSTTMVAEPCSATLNTWFRSRTPLSHGARQGHGDPLRASERDPWPTTFCMQGCELITFPSWRYVAAVRLTDGPPAAVDWFPASGFTESQMWKSRAILKAERHLESKLRSASCSALCSASCSAVSLGISCSAFYAWHRARRLGFHVFPLWGFMFSLFIPSVVLYAI